MLPVLPRWLFHLFLCFLVLLGGSMRFHNIEKKSLWSDELFTLSMAQYHPLVPEDGQPWYRTTSVQGIRDGDTFLTAKAGEQSPPLQDLLEKASVQMLGSHELAARLPGALAACLLLAWFAWFAAQSKDPWGRSVLTWSLLFLSLSPALVIYAQDARAYSLGTSLVGMAGLLWLLRWQRGWRHVEPPGWGEIVLFCLACYTHYNAAALVALLLLPDAIVAIKNRSRTTWVRLLTLAGVFLLWVAVNAHTISFTTKGGVAWGQFSKEQFVFSTVTGVFSILHQPWVFALVVASWLWSAWHMFALPRQALPGRANVLFFLLSLMLLFVGIAGTIVAKAGMAHPRYYIFIVPFFAVALGVMFARLRRWWLIVPAALFLSALAVPGMRSSALNSTQDFRGMAQAAVEGTDGDTIFLFPWAPNRDMYRIYLERFLGRDMRSQMVGISAPGEVAEICARLATAKHVVAIGHDTGHQRIDEVYAACGTHWPQRHQKQLHNTFVEHWQIATAVSPATP